MMIEIQKKIVSLNKIKEIKKSNYQKKITLVGGCFDIFHYGHLMFLQKARSTGDMLIVLLESDDFIKEKKKRIPLHMQQERAEILASLSYVEYVVLLPFLPRDRNYDEIVEMLRPTVIAITEGDGTIDLKKRQAKKVGAIVKKVCKLEPRFSSSKILSNYGAIPRD